MSGKEVVASTMVRMEALVYHGEDPGHLQQVHAFLLRCHLEEIHRSVQDLAVDFRLPYRMKLPDAVISATAAHLGVPLITADTAFARLKPELELVIYGK